MSKPELVIITGMSGAGRTEAVHTFEDLGYFCIDNLPARLLPNLIELAEKAENKEDMQKLAVVCDARNGDYFSDLEGVLNTLKQQKQDYRLIFLEADDEKLIARYKASRRRHPMCENGMTIAQGIEAERKLLSSIRQQSYYCINTSDYLPQQLRSHIKDLFSGADARSCLNITVYSFGFKHGAALDADIVIDVRFLPNPYYVAELRGLTGLDESVYNFVIYRDETEEFINRWRALLDCVMPGYVAEGKQQLAIAIGCTGGQHRSVALAENTGVYLKTKGYRVSIAHRDLDLAETAQRG